MKVQGSGLRVQGLGFLPLDGELRRPVRKAKDPVCRAVDVDEPANSGFRV